MRSYVWIIHLLVTSKILGALSELCAYTPSSTDVLNSNNSQTSSTEECQWGCCGKTRSPCCSVPVSLLVGVILGGVVLAAIVTAFISYYCVYRRGDLCMHAFSSAFRAGQSASDSRSHYRNTTQQAGSSDQNGLPAYPGYSDAPPSYEEVMKGQTNSAFQPDALDRGSTQGV